MNKTSDLQSSWAGLILALAAVAGFTALGPVEKTLGVNVRVVYLHGAWVWAALVLFLLSALAGLAGLVMELIPGAGPDLPGAAARAAGPSSPARAPDSAGALSFQSARRWHRWSRALGRTGLLFWISYLPISMWAMEANWNGLFLAEPRWRLAVIFAAGGLLLQAGIILVGSPAWASAANLAYFAALALALGSVQNIMHPPAPILESEARRIQLYFAGLLALTLLAASQAARLLLWLERRKSGSAAA